MQVNRVFIFDRDECPVFLIENGWRTISSRSLLSNHYKSVSNNLTISAGVMTNVLVGKCLMFPVTR